MPQRTENADGVTALTLNALTLNTEGYGVVDGCGVVLGGSTTDIDLQVGAGTVLHDGRLVSVTSQTVTLQSGDPTNPRKDLIWVDREGTARVQPGIAKEKVPSDAERENTYVPAPPDASRLDGVPLAEIWVPAGTASSGELGTRDRTDRRISASAGGAVEELAADPPEEELLRTRMWYNTTAQQWRGYEAETGDVVSFDTTVQYTKGGPTQLVVESFDNSIDANWRGGSSSFVYDTPAIEGAAAAAWDSNSNTRDYSLPGDGLEYYAEDGDRIRIAIRFESGSERFAWAGFGKESDDQYSGYRVRLEPNGTLLLQVADSDNDTTTLGSATASITSQTWYIVEAGYDEGGRGVHNARLWSTASGSVDTELAAITSPTADETYRGRGYTVCANAGSGGEVRFDRLAVTPDGA